MEIFEGATKYVKHTKLMMVDPKGKTAREMTETHPFPVVQWFNLKELQLTK